MPNKSLTEIVDKNQTTDPYLNVHNYLKVNKGRFLHCYINLVQKNNNVVIDKLYVGQKNVW